MALVSPAGPVEDECIEAAFRRCEFFGFEPVLAPHARDRFGYLAGSDRDRASDLQRAIDDPSIDGIWALRGGYGTLRILDRIDPAGLIRRPVPFIGFSDNTALHAALARLGLPSFHGPHAGNAFPDFTIECFRKVLCESRAPGVLPVPMDPGDDPPRTVVPGTAEGRLAGGNLSLLACLCGTPWAPDLRGRILFIEDIGEAAYRTDRAWTQLWLAGCLKNLAGVVLGRFTNRPEKPGERPFDQILRDLIEPLRVPVMAGAPIGHVDHQWTVPLGAMARLDASAGTLEILEPCVR